MNLSIQTDEKALIGREASDFHDRANLDCADASAWNALGNTDRLVEIFRIDQKISAQLFARFSERAVGDQAFTFANPNARRCGYGMKRIRGQVLTLRVNVLCQLRRLHVTVGPF